MEPIGVLIHSTNPILPTPFCHTSCYLRLWSIRSYQKKTLTTNITSFLNTVPTATVIYNFKSSNCSIQPEIISRLGVTTF